MPEDRVCPHCRAWFCRWDDAWCGYCGGACAQLELLVRPSVLYIGLRPPRLYFELTNLSCAGVELGHIEKPEWLTFEAMPVAKLQPGASLSFFARAHTEAMREPQAGELVAQTSAGRAAVLIMAIEERPMLLSAPESIEVWSGLREGGKGSVSIRPKAGKLRLRGVQLAGIPGEDVSRGVMEQGFIASPERAGTAKFQVNGSRLSRGLLPARMQVAFDGPHGPGHVDLPVSVRVRRPPQLHWAGEHQPPPVCHQTDRQRLDLVFRNQSPDGRDGGGVDNAVLVIHSIELSTSSASGIHVRRLSTLPATVAGGEAHTANFELDLDALRGQPARTLECGLIVKTNLPELTTTLSLRVEPMRRYEGIVAIDFGSSSTCCAVFQPGAEPELLRLDGENLVSPTVVRYVDMATFPPEIETGLRVERAAAESEEFAASVAENLKRRLRERRQEIDVRPVHPNKWTTRRASEAAADYLRDLRHLAEIQKGSIFQEFILTHPARCPQRQHHRLRRALLEAFGSNEDRVSYLSEPIAALVPLMAKKAAEPGRSSYTVASFDLGGGTTDVALMRVDHQEPVQGEVEIRPSILFCTGANFGGEDLTAYLRRRLEERCDVMLKSGETGARLIVEDTNAAATLDIRRNRAALREAAEQFKAHLSQEGIVPEPTQMILRVKQQDGRTADYPFDFGAVARQGGGDLKQMFLEHTKVRVKEVAEMLQEAVTATHVPLDLIQLSGKTSFLAVVREAIQEMFPSVRIVRADDPKECVVKGACLSRSMRQGAVRLILPDSMQRMTSTIGVFAPHTPYFVPVLAADTLVPAEGLELEVPGFWDGAGPVVLWENVGGEHRQIEFASAGKSLDKLGTWEPERTVAQEQTARWTLRLTMKEFDLTVAAIGRNGEQVRFHPMNELGG